MRARDVAIVFVAFLFAAVVISVYPSDAARGQSLIEWIEASLSADSSFTETERAAYLEAFRQRLAGYSGDILNDDRREGAETLMRLVGEGSFDEAAIERTVAVASAAYIAVRKGAPAEAVEGIALYGFSRDGLSAETIATYANGYHDCVRFGVPPEMAEDLVYRGLTEGWDERTFNNYKWAHVEAAKSGLDAEDFHSYLMAHALVGKERPGALASRALDVFRDAKRKGSKVNIPAYEGIYIPKGQEQPPAIVPETMPEPEKLPTVPPAKPDKKPTPTPAKPLPAPDKKAPVTPVKPIAPPPPAPPAVEKKPGGLWAKIEGAYKKFIGAPYVWGGQTPRGTDCSGFVQSVYREAGVKLPRVSQEQWQQGRPVEKGALRKGDLVFFKTIGTKVSHVGIVTSPDGQFVHASSSKGVRHDSLSTRYYAARYAGARRVVPEGMASSLVELYPGAGLR